MRSGRLAEAIRSLRDKDRDIHALVVLRNCKVVVELYAENVTRDHNHALYSVTKSVLSTLIGALLKSGRLSSLDLSVADIVAASTKLEADKLEKARRVRIRHVMSMASGLEHQENPTNHPIYGAADRLQFALASVLLHEPGQRYNYSNGDASIADAVVAAAAGKDLLSYGRPASRMSSGGSGTKPADIREDGAFGCAPSTWPSSVNSICRRVVGRTRPSSTLVSSGRPGGQVRRHRTTDCSGGGGTGKARGSARSISPMGSRDSVSMWCRSKASLLP